MNNRRSVNAITPKAAHTMYWVAKSNPYASAAELARAAGVSNSTLSYWLKQGRKRPGTVFALFRYSLLKSGWCEDRETRNNPLLRQPELIDRLVNAGINNPRAESKELAEAIGEYRAKVQSWLDKGRRKPDSVYGELWRRLIAAGWMGGNIGRRLDIPRVVDAMVQVAQDNPYATYSELGDAVGATKMTVDHWALGARRNPDGIHADLLRRLEAVGWLGYDRRARAERQVERGYQQYLANCYPCAGGCGLTQYKHPKGRNWMCDRCKRRAA